MKLIFVVFAIIITSVLFANEFPVGIYLDVREINIPINQEPKIVMIPVIDKSDAIEKLPSVVEEHFQGKTYEARLHNHYIDKPCTIEILPQQ